MGICEQDEIDFIDYAQKEFIDLDHNPVLLDVGANVGDYTQLFLEYFPKGEAICYEPIPEVFDKLGFRFGADPRVTCKNYGLYNQKIKNHKFYFVNNIKGANSDDSGMSSLHYRAEHFPRFDYTEIKVNLITMDSLISKINRVDFIKIDTEGSEFMVLDGGRKFIEKKKPTFIQWEYGGCYQDSHTKGKDVVILLTELGYDVVDKTFRKIVPETFVENYEFQNYLGIIK